MRACVAVCSVRCAGSDQAREQGAKAARREAQIKGLQHRVKNLEEGKGGEVTVTSGPSSGSTTTTPETSGVTHSFHSPSGNVSCEVQSSRAVCSVASTDTTFVLDAGSTAYTESGTLVPSGAGSLAAYGTTLSAGSIACKIPAASEARGIVCVDAGSGHGFEASRVPGRQEVY